MAEEANKAEQVEEQEPHGEPEADYKALYEKTLAESRKWEKRAKDNADKAKKLDELTAGEQSLEERIGKLEAENEKLKADKARAELVAKVAADTGLPESVVAALNGTDEETLAEQAMAVVALKPKGAPTAPEAGRFPADTGAAKTNAEKFGEAIEKFFA